MFKVFFLGPATKIQLLVVRRPMKLTNPFQKTHGATTKFHNLGRFSSRRMWQTMVHMTSRKGAWLNFFGWWRLDRLYMTKLYVPLVPHQPISRTNTFWTDKIPTAFLLLRQNNGKRVPWNGRKKGREVKPPQLTFCSWQSRQSKPYQFQLQKNINMASFSGLLVSFWEALPWHLFIGHCRVVGVACLKKHGQRTYIPA